MTTDPEVLAAYDYFYGSPSARIVGVYGNVPIFEVDSLELVPRREDVEAAAGHSGVYASRRR